MENIQKAEEITATKPKEYLEYAQKQIPKIKSIYFDISRYTDQCSKYEIRNELTRSTLLIELKLKLL